MHAFDARPRPIKAAAAHLLESAGHLRTKDAGDPLQLLSQKFGDHAATVLEKLGATNSELAGLKARLNEEIASLRQKDARLGSGRDVDVSIGQQFVDDSAVKSFMGSDPSRGAVEFRTKATLTSATTDAAGSVGSTATPAHRDGIVMVPRRRPRVRDLLPSIQIESGSVEWPSLKGRTANAAMVAEGGAKPGSDMQFELKTAPARVIAHWEKASKQVLSDAPQLRGLIDGDLLDGLALKEEDQLLNGDGTGQNLNGMIPQATAFAAPFGVTDQTEIDLIGLSILQLALSNYTADGVVLHPSDWMRMRLAKDADGNYLLGNPQMVINPALFGVPLVATTAMTADTFLAAQFRGAATVYDRWAARIEVGYTGDDFTHNLVTILAEERLALGVKLPGALIYGDFGNS